MLRKIFVYGSLRTDMFNYEKYLKGEVLESTPAKIKGNLFHIENKGYPAIFDGDSEIIGEVFTFYDFSKSIRTLDGMENFNPESPESSEYLRQSTTASLSNGQTEEVYYYHYNPNASLNSNDQLVPVDSGDWLEYMLQTVE
ncbi:gamma-glutamylcyclotransferase family protein [Lactococcus petauri]|uniref:gamma-glutamylcyclotransferase family protein n=1 Tax=Lactococcus petauri TaxID=1940789 RepID=UPI001F5A03BA|nr:gamma-glutamylcyclotransferase family protein [Lactococcus petauri]